MLEPTATLDERYSEAGTCATLWAETLDGLQDAQLFWLATVRSDGRPHMTPLVAVWLDDALHFSTGAVEQKALNLRDNPHVTLATGGSDWDHGLSIAVEGDAVRVSDTDLLARLAAAWQSKWDGRWRFEVGNGAFHHGGGAAIVYRVSPTKVLSFGLGTFSHTRYQFSRPAASTSRGRL